ncbi:hypothetical protein GOP47_0009908 [Adiantum capillus-veneris]|uniref:Uncharacterized protein n=1 Tax=Adiantum capillus-veneris TaxID=13818 RepID=A0A9D4ZJ56_ADICA|nr:hypothetical protein GOP47_0009908 [Adiantum capillus-veneris]
MSKVRSNTMTVPNIFSQRSLDLSREPVKLINLTNQPHPSVVTFTTGTPIATLHLSPLDMLFDNYISVLLFYDAAEARSRPARGLRTLPAAAPIDLAEPVRRLQQALQELLVYFPCAAGLLVYNERDRRLEVRYPMSPPSDTQSCITSINGDGHRVSSPYIAQDDGAIDAESPAYGVHFHVAHANGCLADLGDVSLPQPALDVLYPSKPTPNLDSKGHLLLPRFVMAFQITTFKCGGFTLGHTCSHAYADGHTGAGFLQNLCSIARGAGLANCLHPIPSRKAVINARDPPTATMPHRPYIKTRNYYLEPPESQRLRYGTATRFKFTMVALEALRVSATMPGKLKACSRNQALVAVLWIAFARVSLNVHGLPRSHDLNFWVPMNMRTRGLSMGYMGNALCELHVLATLQELCENSLAYVVDKIEKAMASLDVGEGLQSMVDYIEIQLRDGLTPSIEGLGMPSLVALPFYDTDCGWGAPMYVGRPSQQLRNRCVILDHPRAQAWNVLIVFASAEEHACFQESIAGYIC